ncbi:MAG: hypothetical protein AB7V27_07920 [Candidatus Binatia bacterium]
MAPAPPRGTWLTVCAVLFVLLGISNLLKPFQMGGEDVGFVLFGTRLRGVANAIVGPLLGVYLLIYAHGIWTMRRFALGMGHAYAAYVILNLLLWHLNRSTPRTPAETAVWIAYAAVAIGVSLGAAIALTKRKAELR